MSAAHEQNECAGAQALMACAARGVSPYYYLETDMRIRTQEPAKGAACGGSPAWQGPAHLAGICRSAATPSSLYSTAPGRAPKTSSSGSKSAAVNVADHACRHPWRFAATNPEPLRRTQQRYSSCSQGARRSAAHQLRSDQAFRTFSPARERRCSAGWLPKLHVTAVRRPSHLVPARWWPAPPAPPPACASALCPA